MDECNDDCFDRKYRQYYRYCPSSAECLGPGCPFGLRPVCELLLPGKSCRGSPRPHPGNGVLAMATGCADIGVLLDVLGLADWGRLAGGSLRSPLGICGRLPPLLLIHVLHGRSHVFRSIALHAVVAGGRGVDLLSCEFADTDRKSTRQNSSHANISYA